MGLKYAIVGENQTLSTGSVLMAVRTAAADTTQGGRLGIKRIEISQSGTTTSAQIRGEIFTRDTAGTLTMTSVTPVPLNPIGGLASGITGSTAPAGTAAKCGITSSADSGGAYTQRYPFNFNNLNGYLYIPTPDEIMEFTSATVFGIRFLAAPGTLTGWTFVMIYDEVS